MTSVATRTSTPTSTERALFAGFLADAVTADDLPQPSWGPIGQAVYERTYSRDVYLRDPVTGELELGEDGAPVLQPWWVWQAPPAGRVKEVWAETCRRVVFGNVAFDEGLSETEAAAERLALFEAMFTFRFTPAGRHLWVTGTGSAWTRNCFAAETEVITKEGVRRIGDLAGQTVQVLDGNGGWVASAAKSFGTQPLMRLELRRGPHERKVVHATADHGWFVYGGPKGVKPVRVETHELVAGQQLVSRVAKSNVRGGGESRRTHVSPVGVQHGFVFGDGSLTANGGPSVAYFAPGKSSSMMKWFPVHHMKSKADGMVWCSDLPRSFREMPSLHEASSHLYGFLAGYFAADGSVGATGSCTISSARREHLEKVRDIAARLGIATFSIREQVRQGYGDEPTPLYWITLDRNHLTEEFFLLDSHREKWMKGRQADGSPAKSRRHNAWTVDSVSRTDRVEEVFCFEVPTTRSFVLDGGILTSNCWAAPTGPRTSDHFRFGASRLFEGGGVGSNYSFDLMASTSPVTGQVAAYVACDPGHTDYEQVAQAAGERLVEPGSVPGARVLTVADTREGWVQVWVELVDAACSGGGTFVVDVSGVRPYGAPLRTFGGQASGPAPLVRSVLAITGVLEQAARDALGGRPRRLTGLEAMEIDHQIAASVVAGGSRRSARMSLMRWDDPDIFKFVHAKEDPSRHWSTNISVEIDDAFRAALGAGDEHAVRVLDQVSVGMARDGEPGLIDTGLMTGTRGGPIRHVNPCVRGDSWVQTADGLRQVRELVGIGKVDLVVDGQVWETGEEGFFSTGHREMVELDVDGSILAVTPEHLISTPDGWRPAGELSVGDVVDLTSSIGNSWGGAGTWDEGYLIGALIGDGYFLPENQNGAAGGAVICAWRSDIGSQTFKDQVLQSFSNAGLEARSDFRGFNDHGPDKQEMRSAAVRELATRFGVTRGNKTVTPQIMAASSEFQRGLISALFDCDGHVEGISTTSGVSARLSQSDGVLLGQVRTMMLAQGVKSVVRDMHPERIGYAMPGGSYDSKPSYRLIVSGQHLETFQKVFGFVHAAKRDQLSAQLVSMSRGFYSKPMVGTVRMVSAAAAEEVFDAQVPGLNAFVANGTVIHNCGEATLETEPGDLDVPGSGESCNLGSVNLEAFGEDVQGAAAAFELAGRFLYRATMKPYGDEAAARIEARNRRIGVGFLGLQGWCAANGARMSQLPDRDDMLADLVRFRESGTQAAYRLADERGLPRPVSTTAIAPTGSIAQLSGATPGVTPVFAPYFIRRVRFEANNPALDGYRSGGYVVEPDMHADNTMVVEIPVRDAILDRYDEGLIEGAYDIGFGAYMRLVAAVQESFCGGGVGQAVSHTAQLRSGQDPAGLAEAITSVLGRVRGVTAFPDYSSRPQVPLTAINADEFAEYTRFREAITDDSNDGSCATGACPVK